MRKQQAGFTLIELVMVIVILGILAATAIPKYIDVSTSAADAAAEGAAGAISSATAMNYAQHALDSTKGLQITTATTCSQLDTLMVNGTLPDDISWVNGTTTLGTSCSAGGISTACFVKHNKGTATGVAVNVVCTG